MSVNLAYWHTYKHAAELVWIGFLPELWGPLFHNLYPHNKLSGGGKKPRLPMVLAHMQILRLAYDEFKKDLDELLSDPKLTGAMKLLLWI